MILKKPISHTLLTVLAVLVCLAISPRGVSAQGWEVVLKSDPKGPRTFLAVDKSTQTFYVFEQKSPLKVAGQYTCATGQALGDKLKQGDLRTPEGVYFIQNRLSQGLDFSLYGDLAFTLDFPNPVDTINGKSGGGIWIHGRGKELSPNETKGCVAINTPDLHKLDGTFSRGMPVVIASRVSYASDATRNPEAAEVVGLTQAWAKAWQKRSDEFFGYHDPEKFAISSGAPFKAFVDHKKSLFSSLPWLQVVLDNVQAVQGPGYWVTYFGQYYRSPSLTSEGLKRLYWQRDKAGKWRIVGMEMDEFNMGLEAKFLNRATQEIAGLIESWRAAWEKANVNDYISYYADKATQGDRRGRASIKEQKQALWTGARAPKKVVLKDIRIRMRGEGLEAQFVQEYAAKDGSTDKGRKTLTFVPQGDGWAIANEEWSKM